MFLNKIVLDLHLPFVQQLWSVQLLLHLELNRLLEAISLAVLANWNMMNDMEIRSREEKERKRDIHMHVYKIM